MFDVTAFYAGVTALVYTSGYDGMIYAISQNRFENLAVIPSNVVAYRFSEVPIRSVAGANTLVIVFFYLSPT